MCSNRKRVRRLDSDQLVGVVTYEKDEDCLSRRRGLGQ